MTIQYRILNQRNPIIEFFNESQIIFRIQLIGDPHLGRKFLNGVPKNRLNDREELVYSSFQSLLNQKNIDLYIILGDLFDKTSVSNSALNRAIDIVRDSALANPKSNYYVLNGNHDLVRDKSRISSFDLFSKYFKFLNLTNLVIVDNKTLPVKVSKINSLLFFHSFDPFKTLDTFITEPESLQLRSFIDSHKSLFKIAFGHFEVESFEEFSSKYKSNLVPDYLKQNFDLICTGHIHTPSYQKFEDYSVLVSGSMQPYAFGEEIKEDGSLYTTLSVSRCNELLSQNKDYFKDSCVRVLYKVNEKIPDDFNCLSRTFKLLKEESTLSPTIVDNKPVEISSFKSLVLASINNHKEKLPPFLEEIQVKFLNQDYGKD